MSVGTEGGGVDRLEQVRFCLGTHARHRADAALLCGFSQRR
jgi:hypothetical protein